MILTQPNNMNNRQSAGILLYRDNPAPNAPTRRTTRPAKRPAHEVFLRPPRRPLLEKQRRRHLDHPKR